MSQAKQKKKVDDIDNYKIAQRTNMITYQRRIQAYQTRLDTEMPEQQSTPRFKRRSGTPSPEDPVSKKM